MTRIIEVFYGLFIATYFHKLVATYFAGIVQHFVHNPLLGCLTRVNTWQPAAGVFDASKHITTHYDPWVFDVSKHMTTHYDPLVL